MDPVHLPHNLMIKFPILTMMERRLSGGTAVRLVSNSTETVFAIPDIKPIRGVIVLLHACTHNALKFFSKSPKCALCVGLSEELRIARILLARGYAILAITSQDRISGCWSNRDKSNVEAALIEFHSILNPSLKNSDLIPSNSIAIGASSGGDDLPRNWQLTEL
ncbi:hypothetical protein MHU86_18962 [Fragilaria crotonensis]|nr:hypothetical protein MHU86_18962 [Fragilaria crotonensis]